MGEAGVLQCYGGGNDDDDDDDDDDDGGGNDSCDNDRDNGYGASTPSQTLAAGGSISNS